MIFIPLPSSQAPDAAVAGVSCHQPMKPLMSGSCVIEEFVEDLFDRLELVDVSHCRTEVDQPLFQIATLVGTTREHATHVGKVPIDLGDTLGLHSGDDVRSLVGENPMIVLKARQYEACVALTE
jgi:hypothetical protein